MKTNLLVVFLFTCSTLSAQFQNPKRHIQVSMGYSKHGSGDMEGIQFTTEYTDYFSSRLAWIVGFGGSMHDGSMPMYYINELSNKLEDASVRYTTSGIQANGFVGYSPLRNHQHEIQMRLGALVRYQSSSLSDIISITYPSLTGMPYPVVDFINRSPQRTLSIGGSMQLHYNYTINNKWSIGALAGYQIDSEGDYIHQFSASVGRRF